MKEEFQDFFSNSILKFESMLKTNKFLFFDVDEFESIIIYYLESGNISLSNKAVKMALEQYPDNLSISLLNVESLITQNKIDEAEKLVNKIFEIEKNNPEIIIQKSRIFSICILKNNAFLTLFFSKYLAPFHNLEPFMSIPIKLQLG